MAWSGLIPAAGGVPRVAGLHGVRRGRRPFTTDASKLPDRRPDLVERDFHALTPNELWVADITFVRTVSGFAYTAFITDACTRKIVGWSVASSLTTQALPMIALQQAIATTPAARQYGRLVHHSDRGVQYVSLATPTRWPSTASRLLLGQWAIRTTTLWQRR